MRSLLAIGVLACSPAFASLDSDLLAMAPANTTLLTGIDMGRTQSSQFGAYLLNQLQTDNVRYRNFVTATSFDPKRDLQQVLIATIGSGRSSDSQFVIIARGTFDAGKLRTAAIQQGARLSSSAGMPLLLLKGEIEKQQVALAFPRPDVALIGDLASVNGVFLNISDEPRVDPQLLDQVKEISGEHDVWFATLLAGTPLGKALNDTVGGFSHAPALQSILKSSAGIQFSDPVGVSLDLITRSPEDGRSMGDLLRLASNMAQLQNSQRGQAFGAALTNLQVKVDGRRVHASLQVPEVQMEQMMQSESSEK